MSVRRCKEEVDSDEFMSWVVFLDRRETQQSWTETYLAQIAREVACVLAEHPSKIKIDDFNLKKAAKEIREQAERKREVETVQDPGAIARKQWMAAVGLNPSDYGID